MQFSLKNAGAVYQRLINLMFKDQIDRNMEVYMDDMLVKCTQADEHLKDLVEIFEVLDTFKMKLNLAKCAFRVSSRKLLGFLVSSSGIEANPEKLMQWCVNLRIKAT